MASVTLKAHFDGTNIQLDEPYELPRDAQLLVTVLTSSADANCNDWFELSHRSLERAYSDNEPEYGEADLLP